jgi:hypothetical protein
MRKKRPNPKARPPRAPAEEEDRRLLRFIFQSAPRPRCRPPDPDDDLRTSRARRGATGHPEPLRRGGPAVGPFVGDGPSFLDLFGLVAERGEGAELAFGDRADFAF